MHGLGLVPTVQPLNPTNLLSLLRHRLTATSALLYFLAFCIVRVRSLVLVHSAPELFVPKISTGFRYSSKNSNGRMYLRRELSMCVRAVKLYVSPDLWLLSRVSKNNHLLVYANNVRRPTSWINRSVDFSSYRSPVITLRHSVKIISFFLYLWSKL